MLTIKILGSGCKACNTLEQQTITALEALEKELPSLEATIQHVRDIDEIMQYPIMFTPALVVNEKVVSSGQIPSVEEITAWLREALEEGE